jgi:UDP-2-acetamido-3-amino-2,3-dideoxy-glucuronate N-acetyltransferase
MFELVAHRRFIDERGALNLLESSKELPFTPKRVFWVTGVPKGSERGFHAHKTGNQLLVCLQGKILLTLKTHSEEEKIVLSAESPGVWMKNMVWGEQTFLTEDSVLLVFASNDFDESDYLRDFEEFLKLSKQRL